MTFYIGQKKAGEIFLGGKKIGRIYLGQTLVHMTSIVSKPTFLDYVIFDGASYINTGITIQDCTVKTAVKYEAGHSRRMLTGFSGSGGYWGMTAGKMLEMNGSVPMANTNLTNYSEIEFVFNVSEYRITATINGETGSTVSTTGFGSLTDTYTIGCTTPTSSNKVIGNVYYSTFYNADGVLIQDLRPCIDPKGVVCMYDMVTKKYFYNAGTGELKAGGRFVESIVFDGNSRIDTGIIPSNNMEFEAGVMFSVVQSTNLAIIASRDGEKRYQPIGAIQNKWSASIGGMYDENGSPVSANTKYDLRSVVSNGDSVSLYSGNTLVSSAASSGGIPTRSLYLFARNYSPIDSYVTGRLYYCKIWDNGALVRDMRPYVDSNGVACFKDVVTDTLFYNKGAGTLTYTEHEELEYLELDGTKYIDSGFMPSNNTRVVGSAMFDQWYGGTIANYVFGVFGDSRNFGLNVGSARTFFNVVWGANAGYNNRGLGIVPALDTKYDFDVSKDGSYINGILYISSSFLTATFKAQKTMYIGWSNGTSAKTMSGRIYPMKVYDNGTLVRDMIPVKRSDGVKCMYDRVENKYYELKGA